MRPLHALVVMIEAVKPSPLACDPQSQVWAVSAVATAVLAFETSKPTSLVVGFMVPAPFACGSVMGSNTASIITHETANRGRPQSLYLDHLLQSQASEKPVEEQQHFKALFW